MTSTLETALTLHHQGISVVPVNTDGTKRPFGQWKHYQTSRATAEEIRRWYSTGDLGVGVVTGAISGHLEMLEVEGRAAGRVLELKDLAHASGLAALWEKVTSGWFELSPSGGYHWLYRVAWTNDHGKFPGNTKLAQAANRETTAETRSEGGFVVVAPSAGTVHPTGKPWTLLKGGPTTIPTITPAEREQLHLIFSTLNEYEPQQAEQPSILDQALAGPSGGSSDGVKPGDDYEAKTDWADILTGWQLVFTKGRTRYWRRPGKTDPGFSATTGHAPDRDRLWVFTTSTEFQHETPYTKFGAFAVLHHGGDHTAAARALKTDGFGSEPTRTITTLPSATKRGDFIPENMPATQGNTALATVHDLDQHRATAPRVALSRSDDGNALALIDEHGDSLRYCAERGRWLAWNGHVWQWQPTGGGIARERAKDIARALPSDSEAAVNHKRRALSAKGTSDMLVQASTDPRVTVSIDDLDAHPWELNTPGGIINLRTGTLQPSDPARLHTRSTSCTPDFDADLTLWLSFLHTTFAADGNLIGYMQRLFGYSAVGEVREHLLPFGYGSGGNGKGVAMETIAEVLGDYATSSPNGFLMSSNYAQHSTEIARLAGTRFVICSEVNESDRFDEAKVKLLTGGDRLTARFMRQDDFTFRPTHHLWLVGNYQPPVESGGDSFWRRLRLIPFTHTVPDDQRIEDLQGILGRDHGPAVLAWLAQGAALYAASGLQEPAGVKAATRDYAHSVDTVGRFLEEECTVYPGADTNSPSTTVSALRGAYEKWCSDNGEDALRGRSFASSLQRHGVLTGMQAPRATHGSGRLYGGVMLHSLQPDALDAFDGDRGGY